MKSRKRTRTRLFLEQLEDRYCPAQTISILSGNLTFSGTPVGILQVTETSQGVFQIKEGLTVGTLKNQGSWTVTGNLTLNLTNEPDVVNVDLGNGTNAGFFLPGNLTINLGTGNVLHPLQPVSVYGGTVNGSVSIQGGSGLENLQLGIFPVGGLLQPLTVKGNVNVNARVSSGGISGPGDTLLVNPGSHILGSLITTQVDNVDIGQADPNLTTVDGQVVISDTGSGAALNVSIFGTVNNQVTVVGTNIEDNFTLVPNLGGTGGIINGPLTVDLSGGNVLGNVFDLATGSFVGGSVTLNSGANTSPTIPNAFRVDGTITQSLGINMGNGTNVLNFNGVVGGSMSVTAGTGVNDLGGAGLAGFGGNFNGTVANNLTLNLQGTNYFYFDGSDNGAPFFTGFAKVGGKISYVSGNGNNFFEISTGGSTVNLNVTFGTGNDTFSIDSAADQANLTGFLDWGDLVFGNDTFNQPAGGAFILPWVFKEFQ